MTATAPKPKTIAPLRDARKGFTRAHISAAAKELFFLRGFAAPTMEQVAQAAGIQRSTLYTHFRHKDEILAAIAADYLVALRPVVEQLPGPTPSVEQIGAWVDAFARFARDQRAPTELLVTASSMAQIPPALRDFGNGFVKLLAERLPAFDHAVGDREGLTHAWAMATLRELGWALCFFAQHGEGTESANRLKVAATLLSRFIHDES